MTEPTIAQKSPVPAEVESGKAYYWCSCGKSATQPYCDGSHKGSGLFPKAFTPDQGDTVYLCGCKATKTPPFCDGSHQSL